MKTLILALAALFMYFLVTRGHMFMYFRFSVLELIGALIVVVLGLLYVMRRR